MKTVKQTPLFQRLFCLVMALAMVLTLVPGGTIALETETTLYLKPNANWLSDGARFAAYFFGNGEAWADAADTDGDGIYEVTAPAGYPNVIFCRMNPNAPENSWSNKWNQTGDLVIPADGTNLYTVAEGTWDQGGGAWSTHSPVADVTLYLKPNANWLSDGARFAAYFFGNGEAWADAADTDGDGIYEVTAPAGYPNVIFCRMNPNAPENGWSNKWNQTGDLVIPADGTNLYTVAEGTWDQGGGAWSVYAPAAPQPTYTLAGSKALFGTDWDPSNTQNQMTLNGDGLYEKRYENVAAATYEFKVTDGTWNNSWGINNGNYVLTLTETSHVTILFDAETKAITVETEPVPTVPATEYYLIGYINGADYGCNDDYANLGEYKFVDGQLVATFTQDSYVFIKTGDNASWFMAESYCTDTTVTLKNTSTGTSEKLFVPGNVELIFTLAENPDGSLTLRYTTQSAPATAYYLVGYLNNADYEGTDYPFVNGTLTASFDAVSYVYIQDSNGVSYMTEVYCETDTATLKAGGSEKMKVPANTELTFTLTVNPDGTLTLHYASRIQVPAIPDGYNVVTIHFLKPGTWGSTVNAWVWSGDAALPGYELYHTAWPGSPIPATPQKAGWYDLVIGTEDPQSFLFIFNDGSSQTPDLSTGEITGPTELWVIGDTVYTAAPQEWTHYTATIHFLKPQNWADTIHTYAWNDSGNLLGNWPGTAAAPSVNPGWYTAEIAVPIGGDLNYIFNDNNGNQTGDLSAGVLTQNLELWLDGSGNPVPAPADWVDANRTIHLPGTLGGNNWNAAGNQMAYDKDRGLYTITFPNVTPGTYEYKIAVNGAWAENYGANGEPGGSNLSVTVPSQQDVTFWYNDRTHRVVCSVTYDIDAHISLSGTGTQLADPELDGLYSVTVDLAAGAHSDLKVIHGDREILLAAFTLDEARAVTFFYDPATGMAYHNGSNEKVDPTKIYYTTKDLAYKAPFGAVEAGKAVTFSITTGTDATAVSLLVRGLEPVSMVRDGDPLEGIQRWTCTTSFASPGEYQYYFAITNGSDMVFYCDDNYNSYYKKGDYGEGTVRDIFSIFPYDLVVYYAGFQTPDWMKDAVIYQIFPDRFFDGDPANNLTQTWARGEVDYEYISDWYTLPENPEQTGEPNYPANAHKGDGEWSNEIYGGDLDGIIQRMDYLKALGVNVIYLNPVFWSISNHRYDAVDYTEIDPILGTLGDFQELVRVAEENGMHIILDGVFNHVSDDSVYFDRYYKYLTAGDFDGKIGAYPYWAYVYDYMAQQNASQKDAEAAARAYFSDTFGVTDYSYTEWFAVSSKTMETVDNIGLRAGQKVYSYEGWWGYDSMPVIRSTNGSEYQTGNWAQEIIDGDNSVNAYWISQGMDGWRLDVANEVSDETWRHFRDAVKALDSDAVIVGEIWADATRYLMGDMYDSVMNYVFRDAVAGFARGYLINRDNKAEKYDEDLTASEAITILEILRERYPEEAFYAMMNLVGSHDTARILSYLDDVEDDRYQKDMDSAFPTYEGTSQRAKELQYVVSFLQFTYPGAPTIYYGDEIGMVGGDDPDDRRAMEWGKGNRELVEWYAKLAAIRAAYPALRTGSVEAFVPGAVTRAANEDVLGLIRQDEANTLVVLANRAGTDQTVICAGTWVDLISGETFTDSVTVPAYRGVILVSAGEVKTITVRTADLAPAYDPAYTVGDRDTSHTHSYQAQAVAPGCTEQGYTDHVCSCGDSYQTDFVDATGHNYTSQVTDPTCTEQGFTTHTCSVCGHSYTDTPVDATGHSYTSQVTDPTCTEKGFTTHTCSVCGHSYTDTPVDATGHSYTSQVTDPTCTEQGFTTHTCSVCGHSYTDTPVDATGHDYNKDGLCNVCGAKDPDHGRPGTGTNPPTGDGFPMALLSLVLLGSLGTLAVLIVNRKKLP